MLRRQAAIESWGGTECAVAGVAVEECSEAVPDKTPLSVTQSNVASLWEWSMKTLMVLIKFSRCCLTYCLSNE